jgi:hypothetical protein
MNALHRDIRPQMCGLRTRIRRLLPLSSTPKVLRLSAQGCEPRRATPGMRHHASSPLSSTPKVLRLTAQGCEALRAALSMRPFPLPSTPKVLRLTAQGCEALRAALGMRLSSTPKVLRLTAQGCEALRATLGKRPHAASTPKGLRPHPYKKLIPDISFVILDLMLSQKRPKFILK